MRIGDELTVKKNYYNRNYSRKNNLLKEGEVLTISDIKNGVIILSKGEIKYGFYLQENHSSYIWNYFDINELRIGKIKKIKDRIYESR
jgi:hypothetical protein